MNRYQSVLAAALMVGLGSGLTACNSTKQPGVTSDMRTQWTMVKADPRTTTEAARLVLASDNLKNVNADSTDVDGKVTAKKADGTEITVNVKKQDDGSQVSVTVGMLGDSTLGAEYVTRIKNRAQGQ